jgi:hypothetical protein
MKPQQRSAPNDSRIAITGRRTWRVVAACACLLALASALSACGGSSHSATVASLAGHHTQSGKTTANAGVPDPDGRPRESLYQTVHQLTAMMAPYDNCLFVKHNPLPKNSGYNARLRAGGAACIKMMPLPPWQLDPANPQARAYIGRVVTCLQQKGYHAAAAMSPNNGISTQAWTVDYTPQIVSVQARTEAAQEACQHQAQQ